MQITPADPHRRYLKEHVLVPDRRLIDLTDFHRTRFRRKIDNSW